MKDLETCRKEIDEIDQQMIALFEKRRTRHGKEEKKRR